MFLTVYLSNNEQHFTEVPVTPETVCRDVVDLCKEPGESDCHLAEVWCGSGMPASVVPSFIIIGFRRGAVCRTRVSAEKLQNRVPIRDSVLSPVPLRPTKSFCCFLFLQDTVDTTI